MAGCLPSHRHPSGNKKEKVEKLVSTMQARNIKVLALDFDLTFIDIHTHGEWDESIDALVTHVRPCFRDLLAAAREKGLYVCIVTFHPRGYLIREVLTKLYGKK
jgi:2-hydroxy-3-keto-5-methylthiopentenyl-1-phosphate phosphatase